jgi:antitoxin component of MazEF toxin-antitoxin module
MLNKDIWRLPVGRDIVKVRKVGQTLVVTLTQDILNEVQLKEGDRVLLEPVPPRRIIISKEEKNMPTTHRIELELELLMNKKVAITSEMEFLISQHNLNMPVEAGAGDDHVVELTLKQLKRDRDRLEVEISEKKLSLFDAQGA